MKKAINICMDESLLTDLDSYANKLERSRTYIIEKEVNNYRSHSDVACGNK